MHLVIWLPGSISNDTENPSLYSLLCTTSPKNRLFWINLPCNQLLQYSWIMSFCKFGICVVIICDANIKYCGVFEEALQPLNITTYTLAQGDRKGMITYKYNHFLVKTQAIIGQDRGSHVSILQNIKHINALGILVLYLSQAYPAMLLMWVEN